MARRERDITTESEDADDSPDDSAAGKQLPKDNTTGLRDSGRDQDEESDLGKIPTRRRRIEWETVETWDRLKFEDSHMQNCIERHARELLRASGLPFAPVSKKKPTNLEGWVRRSKKVDKDGLYEVNTLCQFPFHIYVDFQEIFVSQHSF